MGYSPWAEFLLFEVLHTLVFFPTRNRVYRVVIVAAMVYLASQIYLESEIVDPIAPIYLVGVVTALHLTFTAYILCAEGSFPDHWRRVRDGTPVESVGGLYPSPSNFPFTKKLWWMLDIAHSPRMVGWVQQPRDGIPLPPPPSRKKFLREASLKLIVNLILLDLSTSVCARSPAFDHRFTYDSTYVLKAALATAPFLRHAPYVLAFGVMTAAWLSVAHNVAALVSVGLGITTPTLWPDMWGHWGDAYTVRKLWGRTWHQQMRPMVAGLGRLVANKILRFPRGTNWSSYTQLYVAFFLSGAIHFAGDFMYQQRIVFHSFKFFLLQAAAITFEDFIIYTAKTFLLQKGIKLNAGGANESWAGAVVRVIGYCWVTLWFCLTMPVWRDKTTSIKAGYPDRALPISQFVLNTWKQWA